MIDLDQNPLKLKMIPWGTYIIVTEEDRSFKLIDPMNDNNQLKVKTTHQEITELEISPDGRIIFTGGDQGEIHLWKLRTLSIA